MICMSALQGTGCDRRRVARKARHWDERLPGEVRGSLERVRRNVELEARLIDDLLDLTRIARGKLELRREVTDLADLIDQALLTCCAEAVADGRITVSTDLVAGDHRVWADPPRLTPCVVIAS